VTGTTVAHALYLVVVVSIVLAVFVFVRLSLILQVEELDVGHSMIINHVILSVVPWIVWLAIGVTGLSAQHLVVLALKLAVVKLPLPLIVKELHVLLIF
jgi:hypothetical protein